MANSGPSERRKKQNRDAQRTYRKSLLRRIEELENRSNGHMSNQNVNEFNPDSPASTFSNNALASGHDHIQLLSPVENITPDSSIVSSDSSSTLQYPVVSNPIGNEPPSYLPRETFIFSSSTPPIRTAADSRDLPNDLEQPSLLPSLEHGTITKPQCPLQYPPQRDSGALGSSIDFDSSSGTVLHAAIVRGNEAIVKLLIKRGANLNAITQNRKDALHLAVESGQTNIVRFLLGAGANINSLDDSGSTVLQKATLSGDENMVTLLLDAGADVNQAVYGMDLGFTSSDFNPSISKDGFA
ncbi:MAG: hypothetical protein M1820_001861 [Bogoriella megaspora]|nr:MAG: hypothetical protein M1820_001861 [Bogoriella megaspora]